MKRVWLSLVPFALLVGCGEPELCNDGIDNDNDGAADCADLEDCSTNAACEAPGNEDCDNGQDDDGDGQVDCADANCTNDPACALPEDCDNGQDDDGDNLVDCNDDECLNAPNCLPDEVCNDLKDNDRDGAVDCADSDCTKDPACAPGNECTDKIDNDGDGFFDAADPGCQIEGSTSEDDNQCNDGIDNDFDGDIDNSDSGCVNGFEIGPEGLPDLQLLADTNLVFAGAGGTPTFQNRFISPNEGAFLDGCVTGTGNRRLLEWNAFVANVGDRALVVGQTNTHQPIWTENPFFGLLFEGWTRAFIKDEDGNIFAQGHKGSFCMIDLFQLDQNATEEGFDCFEQGISRGFADIYSIGLECQYIDVTGVPPGSYNLVAETDFTQQIPEKSYNNNTITIPIEIP
jgi:hypothetical protein